MNVAAQNERGNQATTSYFSNGTQTLAYGTDSESCAATIKQSYLTLNEAARLTRPPSVTGYKS
jgi:hypothetical protein